jgi:hypothetical protein
VNIFSCFAALSADAGWSGARIFSLSEVGSSVLALEIFLAAPICNSSIFSEGFKKGEGVMCSLRL